MGASFKSAWRSLLWRRRIARMIGGIGIVGLATAAIAGEDGPRHLVARDNLTNSEAQARCVSALVPAGADCGVRQFGRVGVVEGQEFFYAQYHYAPPPGDPLHDLGYPRVVIFEAGREAGLRPILISGNDGAFIYQKPAILHSRGRVLLHIPAVEDGTGNFNRELLYRWKDGAWRDVDVTSWLDDLNRRLRKGLSVLKGVFPDYASMAAETPVWHAADDSNACPTAGHADISLAWSGDRIVLAGLRLAPKASRNDQGCSR